MFDNLRKNKIILSLYYFYKSLGEFFSFGIFAYAANLTWFIKDYISLKKKSKNKVTPFRVHALYPNLRDKTSFTPVDPVYFLQDTWAAKKIFDIKPAIHYDVGSSVKTMGILSQYVPVVMIDIRPIGISLNNMDFKQGTILKLPLEDNSIASISSLCVIEHIGLGRYGDPIDESGSEKAIKELCRVTKPGGCILFSVPVYRENCILFNAHRMFERVYILDLFSECYLQEEKYILGNALNDSFIDSENFQVGLFMFIKK